LLIQFISFLFKTILQSPITDVNYKHQHADHQHSQKPYHCGVHGCHFNHFEQLHPATPS
jgi:hypothetical protein